MEFQPLTSELIFYDLEPTHRLRLPLVPVGLAAPVAVVDVDVHDDDGKLCAVGRGTYSPNVG